MINQDVRNYYPLVAIQHLTGFKLLSYINVFSLEAEIAGIKIPNLQMKKQT